jgi:intracellular multiplication protein IcmC
MIFKMHKVMSFSLLMTALFSTQAVFANAPNVADMLVNFTLGLPDLMRLVTATAYVLGMWFIHQSICELKQFGEQRTQYSSSASLKGPMIKLTVGTFLLYLPSTVNMGLNTLWSDPTPYAYLEEATTQWSLFSDSSFMVIQFIGTIAFIRGLMTLNHLGGASAAQGTFSKGLTHVIAGALCLNLYGFLAAINGTLGIFQ